MDNSIDTNLLGKRIRKARGDLSLREFAKKCKISHTHLDSIEKGIDPRTGKPVSVSMKTLAKLSLGSGLSLDYLMGKEDPAFNGTPFEGMSRLKFEIWKEADFMSKLDGLNLSDDVKDACLLAYRTPDNYNYGTSTDLDLFQNIMKLSDENKSKIRELVNLYLSSQSNKK